MNIIELAREAGFKVDWQHADVAEIKAQRYVAFAAAVIKAHEAELIAGAGESRKIEQTDQYGDAYGYTATQVAAAVAHARGNADAKVLFDRGMYGKRIATLESTLKVALQFIEPNADSPDEHDIVKEIKEVLHAD